MSVTLSNHHLGEKEICHNTDNMAGYLMALLQMKGFGPRTLLRLLDAAGGKANQVWDADDAFLKTHLSKTEKQNFIQQRSLLDDVVPESLLVPYQERQISVISIQDAHYPEMLREIYDPPLLLYVRGNVGCLRKKQVAIVGNRSISEYGRRATQTLVNQFAESLGPLKSEVCITSGLAEGVDGQAHQSALDYEIPTMAVFGCGIDIIFPAFHQVLSQQILDTGGALMSEYPLGFHASKGTFPQRNRIVAGMAQTVLVIEGAAKSGSLITARLALEEGRNVLAVPGSIFSQGSQGPHQLIQQGATPVSNGYQILETLNLNSCMEAKNDLVFEHVETTVENQVLLLEEEHPLLTLIPNQKDSPQGILVDELVLRSGESIQNIQEQMINFELDGKVLQLAGGRVVKCRPERHS